MSGYHNVVLPGKYSEGSVYAVGFDTRVTEIENGQEERMVRYAPGGRRKYQIARGISMAADVQELQRFFIARAGAANSFKFLDVMDHSTTPSKRTFPFSDEVPTNLDTVAQFISGTSYQCVTKYDDGQGHIVTRPVTKLKTDENPVRVANNGVSVPDIDLDADPETGILTLNPSLGLQTVTWGGDYYTPVRFSQATDEAFRVSMPSSQSVQSLPSVELVEEISPAIVSQDYPFGGAYTWVPTLGAITYQVTPINGRFQTIVSPNSGAFFALPTLLDMPEGGPLVVIRNVSLTENLVVTNSDLTVIATIAPFATMEFWVGRFGSGSSTDKYWVAIS